MSTATAPAAAAETVALKASDYTVGQPVEFAANRTWYPGRITKVGKSTVTVAYTKGSGQTYEQAVNPEKPFMAGGKLGRVVSRVQPKPEGITTVERRRDLAQARKATTAAQAPAETPEASAVEEPTTPAPFKGGNGTLIKVNGERFTREDGTFERSTLAKLVEGDVFTFDARMRSSEVVATRKAGREVEVTTAGGSTVTAGPGRRVFVRIQEPPTATTDAGRDAYIDGADLAEIAAVDAAAEAETSAGVPDLMAALEASLARLGVTPAPETAALETAEPAEPVRVRYLHDGQPMPDSQNKLSSVAWYHTRNVVAGQRRIPAGDLAALLAKAGVADPKQPGWSVKLPNGVEISAVVDDGAPVTRASRPKPETADGEASLQARRVEALNRIAAIKRSDRVAWARFLKDHPEVKAMGSVDQIAAWEASQASA
jgi:hypothetical protein